MRRPTNSEHMVGSASMLGSAGQAMLIRDCMSREITSAALETPTRAVVQLMVERHVETVPIVDSGRQLVGNVTAHDLYALLRDDAEKQLGRPIQEIAYADTSSVGVDEPLEAAESLFLSRPWVDRLPVIENGEVVGALSRFTLFRKLARRTAQSRSVSRADSHGNGSATCEESVGPAVKEQTADRASYIDVPDPCIFLG